MVRGSTARCYCTIKPVSYLATRVLTLPYSTPDVLRYSVWTEQVQRQPLSSWSHGFSPLPIALRKLLKRECSPFSKKASPGVVPKPRFGEILHQVSSCQFFFPLLLGSFSSSSPSRTLFRPRALASCLLLAGFLQTLESPNGVARIPFEGLVRSRIAFRPAPSASPSRPTLVASPGRGDSTTHTPRRQTQGKL